MSSSHSPMDESVDTTESQSVKPAECDCDCSAGRTDDISCNRSGICHKIASSTIVANSKLGDGVCESSPDFTQRNSSAHLIADDYSANLTSSTIDCRNDGSVEGATITDDDDDNGDDNEVRKTRIDNAANPNPGDGDYVGNQERPSFYADGAKYWEGIEPTIEGMLGGFAEISDIDVGASKRFLREFSEKKQNPTGTLRALDCGAGIGRVTKFMLSHMFTEVDMLEQNQQFLDKADDYLGDVRHKVGRKICAGLQSFVPDPQRKYDVIWVQWVTGHVTDTDFVEFLKKAANGLRENGLICVKDNLSSCSVEMDNKDSSVTRPRSLMLEIFRKANLRVVGERKQIRFPKGLYEVKMFALRPRRMEQSTQHRE